MLAPSRRAAKHIAIEVARDPARLQEAIAKVHRDVHAQSSKGPLCSYVNTWTKFHNNIFNQSDDDDEVPVTPLTKDKIFSIAAVFKEAGYRSFKNYMEAIKETHMQDFDWNSRLARNARDAARSVNRGIGPARQSAAFDLEAVFDLRANLSEPLTLSGPIDPRNLIILGSFFLLREIEASLSLACSVNIDKVTLRVSWNLPTSKTDPKALGKTRSWGCTCDGLRLSPCPYHAALDHQELLLRLFGKNETLPADLPFFPTADGLVASKESVVLTLESVARKLGQPLKSPDGQRLWGGHTMRVTGAQHLASLGVELVVIALLARWASAIVLRYAAEAPLLKITENYKQKLHEFNFKRFMEQVRTEMADAKHTTDLLHKDYQTALNEELTRIKTTADAATQQHQLERNAPYQGESTPTIIPMEMPRMYYVINDETGVVHQPLVHGLCIVPSAWNTRCGWKFGHSIFSTACEVPRDTHWRKVCTNCLPEVRRRERELACDSSSSSDSVSSASDSDG